MNVGVIRTRIRLESRQAGDIDSMKFAIIGTGPDDITICKLQRIQWNAFIGESPNRFEAFRD